MKIRDLIVLSELLYMPKQIRDHDIHILNSISEKMRIYKCTTFNIQNVNLIKNGRKQPHIYFSTSPKEVMFITRTVEYHTGTVL